MVIFGATTPALTAMASSGVAGNGLIYFINYLMFLVIPELTKYITKSSVLYGLFRQIEKEEMDGDFDDRVDWIDHYKGGRRVMSEIDTDYNGAMDLFKYYEGGNLRRKERDSKGDGRIDFWEYLDEQGNVLRTGRDLDGDGVMDIRDE